MSSTLAHQQQAFAKAIVLDTDSAMADGLFKTTPQGTPARLHIYSDAYRIRLGEALKENYPVLARVLGDDAFADLAAAFLQQYPSKKPSIRWFGDALAEYVDSEPNALPHPSLNDLVRMEWALSTAFDGEDASPLQVADFMQLPPDTWPSLQFDPHPTLQLLRLDWNVEPLWAALTSDEHAETDAPEEFSHHLLVWRREHQTQWRSVEPIEAQLLNAVMAGKTFGQLTEFVSEFDSDFTSENGTDEATSTVAGYLRIWVEAGLLIYMRSTS